MKSNKGITLVALVITIIILIILAGISINMILGQDGLIQKAKDGGEKYKNAAENELAMLDAINELFDGTSSTGGNTPAGPTVANITVSNYGQYVDLGTNILTKTVQLEDGTYPTTDWRVFKKDDNGVWLILADYMPKEKLPSGTGLTANSDSSKAYSIYYNGSRSVFLNGLNSASWKSLISENTNLYNNSNIIVKGAFEIEEWVESWEDSGYCDITIETREDGYYIHNGGWSDVVYMTEEPSGYENTLYVPHKSKLSNCEGYWLASTAWNGSDYVLRVRDSNSTINGSDCDTSFVGVRPAVFLPSSIRLDTSGTVWTIVN